MLTCPAATLPIDFLLDIDTLEELARQALPFSLRPRLREAVSSDFGKKNPTGPNPAACRPCALWAFG